MIWQYLTRTVGGSRVAEFTTDGAASIANVASDQCGGHGWQLHSVIPNNRQDREGEYILVFERHVPEGTGRYDPEPAYER